MKGGQFCSGQGLGAGWALVATFPGTWMVFPGALVRFCPLSPEGVALGPDLCLGHQ